MLRSRSLSRSRSRSRSSSPRRDERRRSRSPPRRRDNDPPRRRGGGGGGGFRWKDKSREEDRRHEKDERTMERGYRKRERSKSPPIREQVAEEKKPGKPKKEKKAAPIAAPTGEPMIIVHVNDRLGTKAAIPCLASDPIRLFKAQVAARVGREPHEILLKRQGERPFKDQLTLEDYGISNGVQLDLEVDTGD
ncbi:MAG: hypothetical protein M1827_005270 [Pycnora praestabilis]|nr:MAG: hypothetical protein M1827_005270 [Pycnora praestabilis]